MKLNMIKKDLGNTQQPGLPFHPAKQCKTNRVMVVGETIDSKKTLEAELRFRVTIYISN